MNLFSVAGCANHWLWKHCNKSCLLILINHKQWCTVNMFQQHYQRRGGFLLFLSLRENIVITPWRCKRAKQFLVFTFSWHLNKDIKIWRWKKKSLNVYYSYANVYSLKRVWRAIQHIIVVFGVPFFSRCKAFICSANERRVIQCMYVF